MLAVFLLVHLIKESTITWQETEVAVTELKKQEMLKCRAACMQSGAEESNQAWGKLVLESDISVA